MTTKCCIQKKIRTKNIYKFFWITKNKKPYTTERRIGQKKKIT